MKKSIVKKITAVVMALVLCASVAVTGIAASAAQVATPDSTGFKTDDLSAPALKDGVWVGTTENGEHLSFDINAAKGTVTITNLDENAQFEVKFDFISAIGLYELYAPERDAYANMRVVCNDGTYATIQFADGACMDLTFEQSTTDFSQPALAEGVWQVLGSDDGFDYAVINNAENSIVKMSAETGTGVPCRFDFISAIGNYQLSVGCDDYQEIWHITANNGTTAALTTDAGQNLTLVYVCGLDDFTF